MTNDPVADAAKWDHLHTEDWTQPEDTPPPCDRCGSEVSEMDLVHTCTGLLCAWCDIELRTGVRPDGNPFRAPEAA